ncbi:MAG: glucosidase, partial [Phormidesmis sp.]
MTRSDLTPEQLRLQEHQHKQANWKKWGPYLSERQWGTVREDYSPNGEAWDFFPHEHARSRTYRWGEDGILGISDERQLLCFALSMWNTRDAILKERFFGLTGNEGNHGEDVKEYYFYLDSTPTHSYMKALYKYPQAAYPYEQLKQESLNRDRTEPEFELMDTGIFEGDRYFDVQVEYAKANADDMLIQISVTNRGPETADCHLLPTLWFRNTWSWDDEGGSKPSLKATVSGGQVSIIETNHP